jgi:hypothetical protein
MDQPEPAGNLPDQLKRNQQIDAICDRFELAWDDGSPPRIEEYLVLLPTADRRSLLVELLASEMALRGRQDEACDRAEYSERFPQYLDVVADVFDRQRPDSAQEAAAASARYFELIQAFRSRRRPAVLTTAVPGSERTLRTLASQLSRHALSKPPTDADGTLEERLWLWILHTCSKLKTLNAGGVDAVVQSLLEAFPPARQSILIDVLLGHASSQAARAGGVTERTVASTIEIATKLLEQAD